MHVKAALDARCVLRLRADPQLQNIYSQTYTQQESQYVLMLALLFLSSGSVLFVCLLESLVYVLLPCAEMQ